MKKKRIVIVSCLLLVLQIWVWVPVAYNRAAVNTILPYVVGSGNPRCTAWDNVIDHSERIVFWGCNPLVTNDIDWYTTLHNYAGYMRALKKKCRNTAKSV